MRCYITYRRTSSDPRFSDILLHQSGHIMLSDFDLAKQSKEPPSLPGMIHEPNGVRYSLTTAVFEADGASPLDTISRHNVLHCQLPHQFIRRDRRYGCLYMLACIAVLIGR